MWKRFWKTSSLLLVLTVLFWSTSTPFALAQFIGGGSVGGGVSVSNNCSTPPTPATKDAVCACHYTQKSIARCEFNQDTSKVFSHAQTECETYCAGRQKACSNTNSNCASDSDCPGGSCRDLLDRVEWNAKGNSKQGVEILAGCQQIEAKALLAKQSSFATALDIPTKPTITPNLFFKIPGLSFSAPVDSGGFLKSSLLSEYITAGYKLALSLSLLIAIIMIMIGGVQYVLASNSGNVSAAKTRITNALIGFILLLCVYLILYLVNPRLTLFGTLEIQSIEQELAPKDIFLSAEGGFPSGGQYEKLAIEIGEKLGFNGCMWALQIAKESGWNPQSKTDCCYGLTQAHVGFVGKQWDDLWPNITCLHSQGCPLCPPVGTRNKSVFAKWLLDDPEGNLLYTGLNRVNAIKKAENPIVATFYFGGGIRTHKDYMNASGCKAERFSEKELIEMLKKGRSTAELVEKSCIPNNTFSVSSKNSCGGANQCCASADGACTQPKFSSAGRLGVCQGGPRAGQKCSAIAGGPGYMQAWLAEVKKSCL